MSKRTKMLFNPSEISTQFHLAIQRDLGLQYPVDPKLLYSGRYDAETIYRYRQTTEFLKKYSDGNSSQKVLHDAACFDFIHRNARLGQHMDNISFPNVGAGLSGCESREHITLLCARLIVHEILQDFTTEELFENARHSSGTSLGLKFVKTNLEDKLRMPLSTTNAALRHFVNYCKWDPQMKRAIMLVSGEVPPDIYDVRSGLIFKVSEVSRLTTVDKDSSKRRVIAIEPTVNMFFQQGLMNMMVSRLRPYLDIESLQPKHRELAYLGSLLPATYATIDFSNASDSVSIELARFLLPPKWFMAVSAFRTPSTSIAGVEVPLRMIGTMGNATTFPLETLFFYALAIATCHVKNMHIDGLSILLNLKNVKNLVSVFGDDCIVPTISAHNFIEICKYVGFEVNREKSFVEPEVKFRESCGSDFYSGRNVRPYYLRPPHNNRISSLEPWLYIITNRLLEKYKSYFGDRTYMYDKQVLHTAFELFRQYDICVKIVPDDYPDDSGLKIWDCASFFVGTLYSKEFFSNWSPISVNKHGTYAFKYVRFVYSSLSESSDSTGLWKELKFPSLADQKRGINKYVTKRIGGYVVSKGISFFPLG